MSPEKEPCQNKNSLPTIIFQFGMLVFGEKKVSSWFYKKSRAIFDKPIVLKWIEFNHHLYIFYIRKKSGCETAFQANVDALRIKCLQLIEQAKGRHVYLAFFNTFDPKTHEKWRILSSQLLPFDLHLLPHPLSHGVSPAQSIQVDAWLTWLQRQLPGTTADLNLNLMLGGVPHHVEKKTCGCLGYL